MSLKTVLQTPTARLGLAGLAISLVVGLVVSLGADVLLGVIVVIPFIVCVGWVRNRHLTLLREAIQSQNYHRQPFVIHNKEV